MVECLPTFAVGYNRWVCHVLSCDLEALSLIYRGAYFNFMTGVILVIAIPIVSLLSDYSGNRNSFTRRTA